MIQRVIKWFRMEYRRAAVGLPLLILKSVLVTGILAILLSGVFSLYEKVQTEKRQTIKIGYVAEDDMITSLAVAYVKRMDAFDGWCRLISVTEEEGIEKLQNGKLQALLILPENVVGEILSGTNTPARMILPKKSSALGIVFEELADAGIRMLSIAQGEIYAIYELAKELGLDEKQLLEQCDVINQFNLELVIGRGHVFRTNKLSITDNEGIAVYYGSVILILYLIFCGALFGSYIKHSDQEQLLIRKRMGIPCGIQLIGRILVTSLLLIITLLPVFGLWLLPGVRKLLIPVFTWQGLALVILGVICVASYLQFLYQLAEQPRAAIVLVVFFTLLQAYLAGCFIPYVLLPDIIKKVSVYIPVFYIRQAFSILFTGELSKAGSVCAGLACSCFFFLMVNIGIIYLKTESHFSGSRKKSTMWKNTNRVSGTLFGIYAKRLFYRKSFWCSLLIIGIVSVGLVSMERQSETHIYAAFYDESGEWEQTLCNYKGYIQFIPCESEEEVSRQVLYNEVECGYVIPENVKKKICEKEADRSIMVFKDADAIMTDTINEILFEIIFEETTRDWFCRYFSNENSVIASLERKMTDGSTFSIEKEYLQTKEHEMADDSGKRTTYPVIAVIGVSLLLCGISGGMEAVEDYRKYRFFKRKPISIILISVLQPVFCGIIVGIMIYLYNSY